MLLAAGYLLTKQRSPMDWGDPADWVWPVPAARIPPNGILYEPVISQEFRADDHDGVDIMYRRRTPSDLRSVYMPGSHDGTSQFFAPNATPIIAARAGTIWSVEQTAKGWGIVISHGKPWATFYQHLHSTVFPAHAHGFNTASKQPTYVQRGQPLGFMGFSTQDAAQLRHLHFEVWHGGGADHAVDPADEMAKWPLVPWTFTP